MRIRGWACVLLLLWAAYAVAQERWHQAAQGRTLRRRCSAMADAPRVLVLLRAHDDAEIGWVLRAIFESAYCPFRVYVGVVEPPGLDSVGKLEVAIGTSSRLLVPLVDHVRSVPLDPAARWERAAWDQLYSGEPWVLFLTSDVLLHAEWDRHLLQLPATAPGDAVVWSATPLHQPYQYPHLHRGRGAGLRQSQSRDRVAAQLQVAHYPCAAALEMPWIGPRWEHVPCALARPCPTLVWSSAFAFGAASLLQRALAHLPPERTSDSLDDCMWVGALARERIKLRLPPHVLATTLRPLTLPPSRSFRPTAQHQDLLRDYAQQTAIDVATARIAPTASMGLMPEPSMDEVMVKYGSRARYEHARGHQKKLLAPQ